MIAVDHFRSWVNGWSVGRSGGIRLNRSGANLERLETPYNVTLHGSVATESYGSISLWFVLNTSNIHRCIFSSYGGAFRGAIVEVNASNQLCLNWTGSTGGDYNGIVLTDVLMTAGQLYHLCVTSRVVTSSPLVCEHRVRLNGVTVYAFATALGLVNRGLTIGARKYRNNSVPVTPQPTANPEFFQFTIESGNPYWYHTDMTVFEVAVSQSAYLATENPVLYNNGVGFQLDRRRIFDKPFQYLARFASSQLIGSDFVPVIGTTNFTHFQSNAQPREHYSRVGTAVFIS